MKRIFCFVAMLTIVVGCQDKLGGVDDGRSDIVIQTNIAGSRVDDGSHNFVTGDKIGLYVVEATKAMESVGNQIDNLAFSYNGTAWSGELTRASLVGTTFKAYSYYPQKSTIDNAHEIEYKVAVEQTGGIVPENYLLHGKSASVITVDRGSNAPTVIPLSFTNCLTRVIAEITAPTTYNGKAVKEIGEVTLMQQPKACKLDVETGKLSYDIYADRVDIKMHKSATDWQCLTIPNSIAAAATYLRIELIYADDSREFMYSYAPSDGIDFAGNEIHTLQISSNELSCYTNFVFGAAGGTIEADIRTNMTETYTLTSNDSWITIADNNVTAAALNSSLQPRMGSLTLSNGVNTRDIVVLQEAVVTIAGTRWLTTNLTGTAGSASGYTLCAAPQDYGMFFKWGDTWIYQYETDSSDGDWTTATSGASSSPSTSNTDLMGYDYAQGLAGGRASGDPCQKLGSSYRTPTNQQFIDLVASGASVFTTYNGIHGYFFGPNAASCDSVTLQAGCTFFSAAGFRYHIDGPLNNSDVGAWYWSSSLARQLYFHLGGVYHYASNFANAMSVRCVEDATIPTVTIAGTKWLTTNLTGTAGTATGHAVCDNPWDYGMFFKWGSTFVYGRVTNADEGGGFRNVEYTRGASTTPTTQSKGYDYIGLNGTWPGDPCQKLGASYKTPTMTQLESLYNADKSVFCSYNGINGCFFGANATGLTGNVTAMPVGCIFLPAAGMRNYNFGVFDYQGSDVYYWSSSVYDVNTGWCMRFNNSGDSGYGNVRAFGQSVRCVQE